jgi:hypothetical protein
MQTPAGLNGQGLSKVDDGRKCLRATRLNIIFRPLASSMAATNPTTATMVDRKHEAFSLLNPWRFEPTALNMWMKSGERCYARWLLKDHAD